MTEIRRDDFYWSHGELEPKVSGAAVAVFNADGEVAAGLALIGQSDALERLGQDRLRAFLTKARDAIHARMRGQS